MGIGTSDGEYYDDRLSHALASEPTREAQAIPSDVQRVYITSEKSETGSTMPLGSPTEAGGALESGPGMEVLPEPYGLNPPEREMSFPRPRASEVLGGFYDTVKKAFSLTEAPAWALDQTTGEFHTSPQAVERAADLAGLMTFGPAPVAAKMAEGTLGSFAGVKSSLFTNPETSTQMKQVLTRAQDLERGGASSDLIWGKTGFFRGADTRWRYEIPDKDMKLKSGAFLPTVNEAGKLEGVTPKAQNPIYRPMKTLQDLKDSMNASAAKPLYLKDAIEHPGLFDAYPELKGIKVYELPKELNPGGTTKGMMWGNELYLKPGLSSEEARHIIMHEVQHRIQSIEGFSSGGSPEMFQPKGWEGALKELRQAKEWTAKQLHEKKIPPSAVESLQVAVQAELDSGYKSLHPNYQSIIDSAKKVGVYNPVKNVLKAEQLVEKAHGEWFSKYEALMGEVEARNVQTRIDYDKRLRKMLPPSRTEPIPRFMQTDTKDLGFESSVSKSTEPTQFRRAANDNQVNKPSDSPFPWLDRKDEALAKDASRRMRESQTEGDRTKMKDSIDKILGDHFHETVTKPHEEFIKKYDALFELGNKLSEKGNWTELNIARYNKVGRELNPDWIDVKYEPLK